MEPNTKVPAFLSPDQCRAKVEMRQLRTGSWSRLLNYFRFLLREPMEITPRPLDSDELELFRDLCMVWIDGNPWCQLYIDTGSPLAAPYAAREVRKSLEASVLMASDASEDHVELLRRVEAILVPEPLGYGRAAVRLLRRILARARPALRAIRMTLPLRIPAD